jgi:hypothetical protein
MKLELDKRIQIMHILNNKKKRKFRSMKNGIKCIYKLERYYMIKHSIYDAWQCVIATNKNNGKTIDTWYVINLCLNLMTFKKHFDTIYKICSMYWRIISRSISKKFIKKCVAYSQKDFLFTILHEDSWSEIPQKWKKNKDTYGIYPTKFASSTQKHKKVIQTPNQSIEIKKISKKSMFSTKWRYFYKKSEAISQFIHMKKF